MTAPNAAEIQSLIDVVQRSVDPNPLELGKYYVVSTTDGRLERIDLTGDQYRDLPRRKTGTAYVNDAGSFLAYWAKHSDDDSEIYAQISDRSVTAVLDANTADTARWGEHHLVLKLAHSKPWRAWNSIDGKLFGQEEFAEFLEDNQADIAEPDAATMLEIAQTIQGSTKAEFVSGTILANGARKLVYNETTSASAGQRGELDIPSRLVLHLQVFDGGTQLDEVTARLRYRISNGKLLLGIRLDRPDDIVRNAFEDVLVEIENDDQVGVPILRGTRTV